MIQISDLGRYRSVGLGFQTELDTPVAPTRWLAANQTGKVEPEIILVEPDYMNKSLFEGRAQVMGHRYNDRSITGIAELGSLAMVMESLYGPPSAEGIFTPTNQNYGEWMPMRPLTLEDDHPTGGIRATGVQVHEVIVDFSSSRNFVMVTYNYHALRGERTKDLDGFTFAVPVLPTGTTFYRHPDLTFKYNGVVVPVESTKFTLTHPIAAYDPAKGSSTPNENLYALGFRRTGKITGRVEFSIAKSDGALDDAHFTGPDVIDEVEFGLSRGGQFGKLIGYGDVRSRDTSTGLDSTSTRYGAFLTSPDYVQAPWTFTVPPFA